MKFKYKKYGPDILRPVIPIGVSYQDRSIAYEVLVDSGADFCIFDAEIGGVLGIDVESGERQSVSGITGVSEYYYVHPVTIIVGGWHYKIDAGFLPNIGKYGYGVVGQKGFFDSFIVIFDLQKEVVELREKKSQ